MATIVKYTTKSGPRYRVRYRKPDGTQTDKRGFKTKREATEFAATVEVALTAGTYIDPSAGKITVAQIGDERDTSRKAVLKPSSWRVEHGEWVNRVRPKWGQRQVASVRPSEIEAWVGDLVNTGLSASVIARAVGVLSGVMQLAVRDGLIRANPTGTVKLPKRKPRARVYLTHEQVRHLADNVRDTERRRLLYLLAYTGLRWGEAVALRVEDVDLLRVRLRIARNAYRVTGEWVIGTPKNGKARSVPMPTFIAEMMEEQIKGRSPSAYLFGDGAVPLTAPTSRDGWLKQAVKRCQRDCDTWNRQHPGQPVAFPDVSAHDLRHTAASLAISAGAHVKAVQQMLGHSSAAMTLDTYADLFEDDLDSVAVKLGEAWENCGQNVGKTVFRANVIGLTSA